MTISLTLDQIRWLEAKVAAGEFATIDEAAQAIISEHMQEDSQDLYWAKPLIDEAREQMVRGEVVSHADIKRELADRLKSLS